MRIQCICGNYLSNSNNPEIQYKVHSDSEWITLLDETENGKNVWEVGLPRIFIWKCPECERLIVNESQRDEPIAIYKLEVRNKGEW